MHGARGVAHGAWLLALLLVVSSAVAARQASSVASFLREERGARLAAYGGAGAALPGDLFASQLNPASLGGIDRYQAAFEHDALILDIAGNHAALAGNYDGVFSWGVYYTGVDYGNTLRTTVSDPFGAANSSFSGADAAVGLMTALSFGDHRQFRVGLTGKYFNLRIDQYKAAGAALDVGGQWLILKGNGTNSGFILGGAVQNIGAAINFRGSDEGQPTTWRIGGAYVEEAFGMDVEAALDLVGGRDEENHVRAGFGIHPIDWLALRVGVDSRRDFASGLSGGFGVKWRDLAVDYAYIPFGEFGSRNRVSLGYAWGASRFEPLPQPLPSTAQGPPRPVPATTPPISTRPIVPQREIVVEPAPPLPTPKPIPPSVPAMPIVAVIKETAADGPLILRPAGEIETAVSSSTMAVVRGPSAAELIEDGDRAVAQGRLFDAVRLYQQAIDLDPNNDLAHFNLATAQFMRKNYALAEASYRAVLKLAPNDAESLVYVGLCRYWQNDPDEARRIWRRILEEDPTNASAREYLRALAG
jgi:hypothetical protein